MTFLSSTKRLKLGGNHALAESIGSTNCLQWFFSFGPTRRRVIRPGTEVFLNTELVTATTFARGLKVDTGSAVRKAISSSRVLMVGALVIMGTNFFYLGSDFCTSTGLTSSTFFSSLTSAFSFSLSSSGLFSSSTFFSSYSCSSFSSLSSSSSS